MMPSRRHLKALRAKAVYDLEPPLIKESLIEDRRFREEYGFTVDAAMVLGDTGVSIRRSKLTEAIRSLLGGRDERRIADTDGRRWRLERSTNSEGRQTFSITRARQRFFLPDFCPLAEDRSVRVKSFELVADELNLPCQRRQQWRDVLGERPITDDEIEEYHLDIHATPVYMSRAIRNQLGSRSANLRSLIPDTHDYYERLIGAYDGSSSIVEYASGTVRQLVQNLSHWKAFEGFMYSLLLSWHSSITSEISIESLSDEECLRAFQDLAEGGDRLSQVGAIEIGLRILPERPWLEQTLCRLVMSLRDDDPEGTASGYKLLSALFVLVDGELSRMRLFESSPPFYRRLASLAHSVLICRQFLLTNVSVADFCDWAMALRGSYAVAQSLVDLRREPHWSPDLISGVQFKAEFLGRVLIAGKSCEGNVPEGELARLVLPDGDEGVQETRRSLRPFLPGPLEGTHGSPNEVPPEIAEAIEMQLGGGDRPSFIALVNSALAFRIESEHADRAASALKRSSYRLANVEDDTELLLVVSGIAKVAAVTRNAVLADELRKLIRVYRRDTHFTLSAMESLCICLEAAASREDLDEWRTFVGEWLTELAFGNLTRDDAELLHSNLKYLCHIVPELWVTCGRAEAAVGSLSVARAG